MASAIVKAHVKAFGCTLSQGESLELSEAMRSSGIEIVPGEGRADICVIHTCVVIDSTARDMVKEIEKARSEHSEVHVFGCLPPTLPHLVEDLPGVFLWDIGEEGVFLEQVRCGRSGEQPLASDDLSVPLPIATGCLGNCTYCLTKRARGDLVSRKREAVVRRLGDLYLRGYREFKVTAQDTGCYGLDIGTTLPELVNDLLENKGDLRLRIGMMNPGRITGGIIDMFGRERVYRVLHMPIQSGSDRILRSMRRGYTSGQVLDTVERVRRAVPDINISTDVIVGYPGEEEDDLNATLELIRKMTPGIVNVTRYSPRPGTIAASFHDVVDGPTIKRRSRTATEVAAEVTDGFLSSFLGREMRVFPFRRTGETVMGRTDNYLLVELPSSVGLGEAVYARLERLGHVSFKGRPA